MSADGTGNRRALGLLVDALDAKARAAGFDGLGPDSWDDMIATLARDEWAFALLDDYEARLGLDVAAEWTALADLYAVNGHPAALALAVAP